MELTEWMGIASTIGLGAFSLMKFRQAQKVDAVSAQSGVASNHRAGTDQVIQGLNQLVDQYQEDIKESRAAMQLLEQRIVTVTAERDALRLEVARLRKKYGDNGDTPQPVNKVT